MDHLRRIAGFAVIPAMTMISTVLLLPIVSDRFGPEGWAALGLGQSIGAFVSVIAGLAWHVFGPHRVAVSNVFRRQVIYAESIKTRGVLLGVLLPFACVFSYMLAPSFKWESVLFVIAVALNCFTAAWYFAGTGQPKFVIRNEAVLRLSGYLVSIPLLMFFGQLWLYGLVLMVTGVSMAVANITTILHGRHRSIWRVTRPLSQLFREQLHGSISRVLSAAHMYLGISMVAILVPQGLPIYTALDTVQKSMNNATTMYPAAFAWWVGSSLGPVQKAVRIRRLLILSLSLGILLALTWAVVGQWVMGLLFQGRLEISFWLNAVNGWCMAAYFVANSVGQLGLVPIGREATVYRGTSIGAVVGFGGLVLGVVVAGVPGALLAIAIVYSALAFYYFFFLRTPMKAYSGAALRV